jgi:hypothetical protein
MEEEARIPIYPYCYLVAVAVGGLLPLDNHTTCNVGGCPHFIRTLIGFNEEFNLESLLRSMKNAMAKFHGVGSPHAFESLLLFNASDSGRLAIH